MGVENDHRASVPHVRQHAPPNMLIPIQGEDWFKVGHVTDVRDSSHRLNEAISILIPTINSNVVELCRM